MAEQTRYPYTTVPGKLRDLLRKAPNVGVPDKLTVAWLKKAGWTSSNDPSMIPVLKFVELLGEDGRPSPLWEAVRAQDSQNKARLAEAIRKAYSDLFGLYPDAHRKDAEALRNFFRAHTAAGEQAQTKMVQTFQVLVEFADFDSSGTATSGGAAKGTEKAKTAAVVVPPAASAPAVTLNVNIQLQLPATSDAEVYERLFESMRRHIIGLVDNK